MKKTRGRPKQDTELVRAECAQCNWSREPDHRKVSSHRQAANYHARSRPGHVVTFETKTVDTYGEARQDPDQLSLV